MLRRKGREARTQSACRACSVAKAREAQIGVTREEVDNAFLQQKGLCGICGIDLSETRYAADHCHETGEFRGILCKTCNSGIGLLKDSPELMLAAIEWVS